MNSLEVLSRRLAAIYDKYYQPRVEIRALNLYKIFDAMATPVEESDAPYRLHMDIERLAELIRSYFLDALRYKEYHLSPDECHHKFPAILAELGHNKIDDVDPLSEGWTRLLHETANINSSKVAALTVKWVLMYKPISVASLQDDVQTASQPMFISCINEFFALNCAFFILNIDASDVDARKIDELIYSFRFRKFDESAYFMIFTNDYLLAKPQLHISVPKDG